MQNDDYLFNQNITLRGIDSENELFGIKIQLPSLDQNQNYEIHGAGRWVVIILNTAVAYLGMF